jgi:hypothetical protein
MRKMNLRQIRYICTAGHQVIAAFEKERLLSLQSARM